MNKDEATKLGIMGRFGWHWDPAVDFQIEVDDIEGMAADVAAGGEYMSTLKDRVDKAMQFNVCMDATMAAKNRLRVIDKALTAFRSIALRQDLNEGRR